LDKSAKRPQGGKRWQPGPINHVISPYTLDLSLSRICCTKTQV
jgi:hypothetical protein